MKNIIANYKKLGAIVDPDGTSKNDRILIANYFYHLSFHIENSIRELEYIKYNKFFQSELFIGTGRLPLIKYYRNHVFNFLSNIGMICDGIKEINKIDCAKDLLSFDFEKKSRNTSTHIFEKISQLNSNKFAVNGFNIIENEQDKQIKIIKNPICTLDLVKMQIITIYYPKGNKKPKTIIIDLTQTEKQLVDLQIEIEPINDYINKAWYSWR